MERKDIQFSFIHKLLIRLNSYFYKKNYGQ